MPQHRLRWLGRPFQAEETAVERTEGLRPSASRTNWLVRAALACAAALLFFRLDHYALWDDEAGTALTAKSILHNGDASAFVDDHNIFAYRSGFELRNLKLRYLPPLPAHIVAGSFWLAGGPDTLVARLPFALFGFAAMAWVLGWCRRAGATPVETGLVALGLVTNVSLILYSRQCRYYALAILLTVVVAYFWLRWQGGWRQLAMIAIASVLLFATNYLNYAALYACGAIDYLGWRRHERPLRVSQWLLLLGSQVLLCGVIAWIWNPAASSAGLIRAGFVEKLTLFGWQWRDLNRCEFLCVAVLVAAAVLAFKRKDRWLIRSLVALVVYVATVTALSPQPVKGTFAADVRYLVPLIPLGVFVTVRTLLAFTGARTWLAVALASVVFGTNLLHGGPLLWSGARSTLMEYVNELVRPPGDPYQVTAAWIRANVRPRQTIWVQPEAMMYPLMFHAPKPIYAWQFATQAAVELKELPRIHFQGLEPPDFVVVFGPAVRPFVSLLAQWRNLGVEFEQRATLDHFWMDRHRPELIWREFGPVKTFDRHTEAIYIFQRRIPGSQREPS